MSRTAEYIREAREQKGLTLAQVEEATRIPRYYLEILEGGGDDRLVSDRLYMVHFLRNYAAFLEVEEEVLAAQFVRENRQREPEKVVQAKEPRSWKAAAMATLALLVAIGAGAYLYDPGIFGTAGGPTVAPVAPSTPGPAPVATPEPPPPVPAAPLPRAGDAPSSVLQPEANETDPSTPRLVAPPAEPLPATAPPAAPEPAVAVTPPAAPDAAAPPDPAAQPEVAAPPPAPEAAAPDAGVSPAAPEVAALPGVETAPETTDAGEPEPGASGAPDTAAVSEPPDPAVAEAPAGHLLTIAAEERSWLRVWIDGGRSRDLLLSPGTTTTLSAETRFVITFGNAGGVRLTLNGEELPRVGASGQVVRNYTLPVGAPGTAP